MTDKLLPCPFCGGEAEITGESIGAYAVGCSDWDGCIGFWNSCNYYNTEAEAIAAWNTRTERTCYADELTHQRCRYSVNRGWRERTCRWEYPQGVNGWVGYTVCSSCGEKYDETVTDTAHYCPNCGAKVVG